MATTLEIINGISQVLANTHDGAIDENGEPIKIGLKREEGDPIIDSRVMDGFSVYFHGNNLCITYQSEIKLKDVHQRGFENDINAMLGNIAKFLKKEYKKITGNALTLTPIKDKETEIVVQNVSRIRSWVTAKKYYTIGGMTNTVSVEDQNDPKVDTNKDIIRKWLEKPNTAAKPKNVKIAKNVNAKKEEKK